MEIFPLLGMHVITTRLPALLSNSADHEHLLQHVPMALCPSRLLTVTAYADTDQNAAFRGTSQGLGGWFLGFKGASGSLPAEEFWKLCPSSPLLPPQNLWCEPDRTLSLSSNQCGSRPQLILRSWDDIISSLAVIFQLPSLIFPFPAAQLGSDWPWTDAMLGHVFPVCGSSL